MKKIIWKYKVIYLTPDEEEKEINKLGKEGWELITLDTYSQTKAYFKKRIC